MSQGGYPLRKLVPLGELCPYCNQVHDRCAAHRAKSDPLVPCRQRAISGAKTCRHHGGTTYTTKRAIERRRVEADVAKFLAEIDVADPNLDAVETLLWLITVKRAEIEALRLKVNEMAALDNESLVFGVTEKSETIGGEYGGESTVRQSAGMAVWWSALRSAEDQLHKYVSSALQHNIDERRVQIAERIGAQILAMLRAVQADLLLKLVAAGLPPALEPQFRVLFDESVRTHVLALRGD